MRLLIVIGIFLSFQLTRAADDADPQFLNKLQTMYDRSEKSIKIIREQITQNQSAPFLPDLYLQLGDLLAEKSNISYYIQMERDRNTDLKVQASKKFSPVVMAQQEAIGIYKIILKEFPKFDKRDKVFYRLAVAEKSIDETAAFIETCEKLIKDYPKTKEAIQASLLLGQHYYDAQEWSKSLAALEPIQNAPYPFERNSARYRIGIIKINQEKFKDALLLFEKVASDEELKEVDNPAEVSLKTKTAKSNIKREALIDSVRAYTEVYKVNPDPVSYYSKIVPTEVLFQEVIEKLAYRYIFLKKYNFAIKLLRTLSERTSDPQKIMNIYQEVLVMIPLIDRIDVPIEEMQFVLEKFNDWSNFYELPKKVFNESYNFFEKQIRELGTRSHELAKSERDSKKKEHLYERSRVFYILYLGFFDKSKESVKIAVDLGDVYYHQEKFLKSGDYYLRTFLGDFGPASDKKELVRNAILAFQKKREYTFYEQIRVKGLLVKAIKLYMEFDKSKRNDPQLKFTLAKTIYEQGLYDQALASLFNFMKAFPNSKDVESAADLILEYFNIRSDFKGIADWSQKIINLKLPNSSLNARMTQIHSKALLKKLDEQVKSQKGYDMLSQGKSYLETALSAKDESLRSVALEQALARSRAEKDVDTFVKAATLIAKKETNAQKRAQITNSMADETLAITRDYQTLQIWKDIYTDSQLPVPVRSQAFEKAVKLVVMLKDWIKLSSFLKNPLWRNIGDETRNSVRQQLVEILDSPVEAPAGFTDAVDISRTSDDELLSYFKAQYKLHPATKEKMNRAIHAKCANSIRSTVCKWAALPSLDQSSNAFVQGLQKTKPALENVQAQAGKLNPVLSSFKAMEGSGDPQLDILLSLKNAAVYQAFGDFLKKTSLASPKQVQAILNQKADESFRTAKSLSGQCKKIIARSELLSPINRYCKEAKVPSLREALAWKKLNPIQNASEDPQYKDILDLQKRLFVDRKNPQFYLDLAEKYLSHKNFQHAAATSVYGLTTFSGKKEDFSAILGCSVGELGLLSEASFHFKNASDYNGLKSRCEAQFKARMGDL